MDPKENAFAQSSLSLSPMCTIMNKCTRRRKEIYGKDGNILIDVAPVVTIVGAHTLCTHAWGLEFVYKYIHKERGARGSKCQSIVNCASLCTRTRQAITRINCALCFLITFVHLTRQTFELWRTCCTFVRCCQVLEDCAVTVPSYLYQHIWWYRYLYGSAARCGGYLTSDVWLESVADLWLGDGTPSLLTILYVIEQCML